MKQGTLITKITIFILFAAVVLYLGFYAAQSLMDPFSTALAFQDTLDDSVESTGVVVREEQILSDGAAIMELLPAEGERISAGETVAVLYQNREALERENQLQTLTEERSHLLAALNSGGSLQQAATLEQQIIESILTLHCDASKSDLSSLESHALALRAQVLQREFSYSASGDSAAALTETIADLDAQISQLEAQSSSDTVSVYAPRSGLFSGLADGLESTLTPTVLDTLSAGQLRRYITGTSSPEGTPVGKLITGDRWYFATVVDSATAERLLPGDTITVAFSKDYSGEVDMRVERVGQQEEEGCVLVLSSSRHLKDVTLLRTQTVDLIFKRYTGIRIPKTALHMETMALTNSWTGETSQVQVLGVYTVVGSQAEFNPVDIVREGSDYYLVAPSEYAGQVNITYSDNQYSMVLPASTDAGRRILHAGDEIIITAKNLSDGKVVLE